MNNKIKKKYKCNHTSIITKHIRENISIYILFLILFIVGLFLGVIIVNNQSDNQKHTTIEYVSNTINLLKTENKLNKTKILKQSLIRNLIIVVIIWVLGLTIFGKIFIYIIIFLLGTTFGYTTSSLMLPFNFGQSILLFLSSIFFQSIITIPVLFFLCVEGIKYHRDFLNGNNIKLITARYSMCITTGTLALIISSIVEVYISGSLITKITKYL